LARAELPKTELTKWQQGAEACTKMGQPNKHLYFHCVKRREVKSSILGDALVWVKRATNEESNGIAVKKFVEAAWLADTKGKVADAEVKRIMEK